MKKFIVVIILIVGIVTDLNSQIVYTWTGLGLNSNFSNPANWSPTAVPSSTDDVMFDVTSGLLNCDFDINVNVNNLTLSSTFLSTVDALTGSHVINGNFVQDGGVFNMPPGIFVLNGDLTRTGGTLNFQATTALNLSGNSDQSLDLNGSTVAALNALNSGFTRTITVNGSVSVSDSISSHFNSTLNTGGSLTLTATSSLKGRVGRSVGQINGNVTIQTFIPGPTTGWANLGINGVNGQIIGGWDGQIPMTCDGCIYSPGVITGTFYSIVGWSESAADYDTTVTVNTPLNFGRGFWVYVGSGQGTTSDLLLENSGIVVRGGGTLLLSRTTGTNSALDGFNLISNPYASPISWTKWLAMNPGKVASTIYGWNADIGGGGSTSFNNGTKIPNNSTCISDVIPGGQAFYVECLVNNSFLIFDESIKVDNNTGTDPLLKQASSIQDANIRLKLTGFSGEQDETVFRATAAASGDFDVELDAHKILQSPGYMGYPGPYTKYTTISSKDHLNRDYALQSIPPLTQSVSIPVLVRVMSSGTYTIEAINYESMNGCILLKDNFLNSTVDLRSSNYIFTMNDTTLAARFELILCQTHSLAEPTYLNELSSQKNNVLVNQDAQGAYVKTAFEKDTKAVISAYNIVGQKIIEDITVNGTVNTTYLPLNDPNQVVFINVTSTNGVVTKKILLH